MAIVNPKHEIEFPPVSDCHLLAVLRGCLRRDPYQRPSIEQLLSDPYLTGCRCQVSQRQLQRWGTSCRAGNDSSCGGEPAAVGRGNDSCSSEGTTAAAVGERQLQQRGDDSCSGVVTTGLILDSQMLILQWKIPGNSKPYSDFAHSFCRLSALSWQTMR